jgi:hypothetical protein
MRSVVQTVKGKKIGFQKDILVRVLCSISGRIWIVTRNSFLYIYGHKLMQLLLKTFYYFSRIHVINIFQIRPFLHLKKQDFLRTVDLCFACSFHFIMVPFYKLRFLKITLPARNKDPPLSETGLPFSQILPLQLFGFYIVFEYMLHSR